MAWVVCVLQEMRERGERGEERGEGREERETKERETERKRSMVRQSQISQDVFTALISAVNINHFPKDRQIMGFEK